MKFYFSIIFFCFSVFIAQSQTEVLKTQIDLNIKHKTVQDILENIENNTNITFSYNNSIIHSDSTISTFVFNGNIEDFLNKLFPCDIKFSAVSNNIILYPYTTKQKRSENIAKVKIKGEKGILPNKQVPKSKLVSKNIESAVPENNSFQTNLESYAINPIGQKTITSLEEKIYVENVTNLSFKLNVSSTKVVSSNNTKSHKNKHRNNLRDNYKNRKTNFRQKTSINKNVSIALFYQILDEKIKYDNFSLGEDNDLLKEAITSSEKCSKSFRFGFKTIIDINNFRITSGIAFKESKEKFNYSDLSDSLRIALVDTLSFISTGTNTYHYLSVPLLVGYQKQINKKISFNGNVGLWFNLLYERSGSFLNISESSSCSFEDLKNAPLKKVTTDLTTDLAIEYNIYKKFYINAGISYMYPLSSMFDDDYSITKLKTAVGYNFSLIYKFNP